jgi:hypothetical protein
MIDDIKTLDFEVQPNPATSGTSNSCPTPKSLEVNDQVTLICHNIPVIVTVRNVDCDPLIGTVHCFENYSEERA